MQFENLNFCQKNMFFLPALALIFAVKIRDISAFFDLILLKLHIRTSLNHFLVFVL